MKKEYAELRRRPLLTPLWLAALAGLLAVGLAAWFALSMTTTTVVVVRHAEKEFSTISDPPLSQVGEQRAELLARLFGSREGAADRQPCSQAIRAALNAPRNRSLPAWDSR